jgi:tetratricopeptide (TPR) repeat protein
MPLFAGLILLLAGCAQNLVNQGRQLANEGQHDQAIELLYQEIANHPDNLRAWQELGVAFYKKGDLVKAEDALKKADKTDPRTHLYLGLVNEAREQYDYAIASYSAALKLDPGGETKKMIRTHLDQLIHRRVQAQVNQAVANESEINVAEIPTNTVAVTDFDGSNLSPELAPIAVGLAEFTAVDLSKVSQLRVVERMKLDVLMQEIELGKQGFVDPAQAPRVGRLLGSSRLVTGSVLETGDKQIRLDGAIVNVRDSSTTMPQPVEGELQKFFEVQKSLVFEVINDLGIQLTAEERDAIQEVPTESYLAFLAYSRGLDYQRRGMYRAAQTEFTQALEADPNFGAADQQLQASISLQAPPVTSTALAATADQMQAGGQQSPLDRAERLRWMADRSDNTLSAPKVPPGSEAVGTIVIRGNLDGN